MARHSQFMMRASVEEKDAWATASRKDGFPHVSEWLRKIADDRIAAQKLEARDEPPRLTLAP